MTPKDSLNSIASYYYCGYAWRWRPMMDFNERTTESERAQAKADMAAQAMAADEAEALAAEKG